MTARIVRNLSWISVAFVAQQLIKLGTNVILAIIVTPAVFGVMLILNTLRTGVEQLSDVGVGQNIVFDPMGNEPHFYNTAWTIQIVRGVLLFGLFLLAAPLLETAFEGANLEKLLPLFAPIFLITGCASPALFLLQKIHHVSKSVILQLIVAFLNGLFAIAFAIFSPTAESLVYALLLSSAVGACLGATFMDWRSLRLSLDWIIVRRIVFFGKWVFVSTLFYFAATSFDRLYLAAVVPITLLGVYGIARTFSDAAFQLAQRISALIIFPTVADAHHSGESAFGIDRPRKFGVLIAGMLIGTGLAVSDLVVEFLYDDRYRSAMFILPVLLFGCWFSILSVINEAIAYGSGKPAINAGANAAKFTWLIALMPLAFNHFGFLGALLVIGLADIPRYTFLTWINRANRLQYFLQDLAATSAMLACAAIVRALAMGLGFTADFWPAVPVELMAA